MRSWTALAHVWPGLPQVWRRGSWSALGAAAFFSVLVNATLLMHVIHPEWFSVYLRGVVCSSVAVYWIWFVRRAWMRSRQAFATGDEAHEGLFLRAQAEYLRGHWYESEAIVRSMLRAVAEDLEARLLLVSVLRRTGRHREALRELRRLARLPGANKWDWELARERAWLQANAGDSSQVQTGGIAAEKGGQEDEGHDDGPALNRAA